MGSNYYSIPDALKLLFGSDILSHAPSLRTKANSFLRNELLSSQANLIVHKNKNSIPDTELDTLFNAMLLSYSGKPHIDNHAISRIYLCCDFNNTVKYSLR